MAQRTNYRAMVLSEGFGGDTNAVRASYGGQSAPFGIDSEEFRLFLRDGSSGETNFDPVYMRGAMNIGAFFRGLHILAGIGGNLPIDVYRRIGENSRTVATDHPLRDLLTIRPNRWQAPVDFRRMLTAWAVARGNGYALKIRSRGQLTALWPMRADRVTCTQNADMSLSYRYTTLHGQQIELAQDEVLHLRGLTLDGIVGIGVIAHARHCLDLARDAELAGRRLYRQGKLGGGVLESPNSLSDKAFGRLKDELNEQQGGAENAGRWMILEEGLKASDSMLSASDAQFLETRKFQASDILMFMGVPPAMAGVVDASKGAAVGQEAQNTGFLTYTAEDWLQMWEQGLGRDCLDQTGVDRGLYVKINRNALMRGDVAGRTAYYAEMQRWGNMSPDEVRALEDLPPRPDGKGGVYYDPADVAGHGDSVPGGKAKGKGKADDQQDD